MQPMQLIAIVFAVFAYSRALLRFKDNKIAGREFLFWTIIWVSVIVLAVFPKIINSLSGFFGIGRPIDVVIYASIIVLFYLIFRMYVKIESMEQNITKVVREVTINNPKKKK